MNCMCIVDGRDAIVVDCGVTFTGKELGALVVHPRLDALDTGDFNVRGVFITHAHEDHMGGLPRLLQRFDVPIYAPPYACAVLDRKAREHEILDNANIHSLLPGQRIRAGGMTLEATFVTHSMPDAMGFAIETSAGRILHSGDFKIDATPPIGPAFEKDAWERWGKDGVALLMSDSTNSEVPGRAGSESDVEGALEQAIAEATGAVFVGLFASNVHRLAVLGRIAQRLRKQIILGGRSMDLHSGIAQAERMVSWPSGLVLSKERIREVPREKQLVLVTGSQAEPESALHRIAHNTHPQLRAEPGDTVILSSRVIPGNELEVGALVDALLRRGLKVVTSRSAPGIHVSGHACREEQRSLLQWTQPQSFLPLHGARRHLEAHAELARSEGVGHVCIAENGTELRLSSDSNEPKLSIGNSFMSGRAHMLQGDKHDYEVPPRVIEERLTMARGGTVFVAGADRNISIVASPIPKGMAHELQVACRAAKATPQESIEDAIKVATRRVFRRFGLPRPLVVVQTP
jgi:ribonuclease J